MNELNNVRRTTSGNTGTLLSQNIPR